MISSKVIRKFPPWAQPKLGITECLFFSFFFFSKFYYQWYFSTWADSRQGYSKSFREKGIIPWSSPCSGNWGSWYGQFLPTFLFTNSWCGRGTLHHPGGNSWGSRAAPGKGRLRGWTTTSGSGWGVLGFSLDLAHGRAAHVVGCELELDFLG